MDIIPEITYKPGWKFYSYSEGIGVIAEVVFKGCTDYGTFDVKVDNRQYLLDKETKLLLTKERIIEHTKELAWKAVRNIELHEAMEHLKYNGTRIMTPHLKENDFQTCRCPIRKSKYGGYTL